METEKTIRQKVIDLIPIKYRRRYNIVSSEDPLQIFLTRSFSSFSEKITINIWKRKNELYYFDFTIEIIDFRPTLLFFKNFNFKLRPRKKSILLFIPPFSELNGRVKIYLDYFFHYKNAIVDIRKLSDTNNYGYFSLDSIFPQLKKIKKRKIDLTNFPQIEPDIGKEYLNKILNLIEHIKYCNVDFIHGAIPLRFYASKIESNRIYGFFSLFCTEFLKFSDVSELSTYHQDSKISFIVSYLHHYNLLDQFCVEIQKQILKEYCG